MPRLGEHLEDVPLLVDHTLRNYCDRHKRPRPRVSDDAMITLREHVWPGNVRQLENMARRVALLAPGPEVTATDLPQIGAGPGSPPEHIEGRKLEVDLAVDPWGIQLPANGLPLPELEEMLVREALATHHGNKSAAARYLGIKRHVLLYRLEKYGIETKDA